MVKGKPFGGLGFKEIISFNLAMLVKFGWRIICNPDSLLAMVLRDKYYPSSSFCGCTSGKKNFLGLEWYFAGTENFEKRHTVVG